MRLPSYRFPALFMAFLPFVFLVVVKDLNTVFVNATDSQIEDHSQAGLDSGSTENTKTVESESTPTIIGVDYSWPTQHDVSSLSIPVYVKQRYNEYMNGCYQHEKGYTIDCDNNEKQRIHQNLYQPSLMSNLTTTGFTKLKTPAFVLQLLTKFWISNLEYIWEEFYIDGNTYLNHWKTKTSVLDIGRKDIPYIIPQSNYEKLTKEIQTLVESWVQTKVVMTTCYGIRAYQENAILAPTVDNLPHVITAIIPVVQHSLKRPWILELIGHDGLAQNMTVEPGEIVLYEGTSIIHGRPYPLQGNQSYYACYYMHFEPLGYTVDHTLQLQKQQKQEQQMEDTTSYTLPATAQAIDQASKYAFEKALLEQQMKEQEFLDAAAATDKMRPPIKKKKQHPSVPRYVWPQYESTYGQQYVFQHESKIYPKPTKVVFGKFTAHQAASMGDLIALKDIAKADRNELFKADINGWRPIHEAARSGHAHILEYLLEEGAQVNDRTNNNRGGNALYWAEKDGGGSPKNADAIAVLKKYGGVNIPPLSVSDKSNNK